ncbi:hypothetical protein E2C01_087274 [Portunus trituberculatus]|uniref:Uncharacterized protein n=1 Tax=Portunus trituberculatus TaxID=210409 RepID=A0A5B7JBG8_PORTR|nr:hypothetical protein [Portunus trituberculatus]
MGSSSSSSSSSWSSWWGWREAGSGLALPRSWWRRRK